MHQQVSIQGPERPQPANEAKERQLHRHPRSGMGGSEPVRGELWA